MIDTAMQVAGRKIQTEEAVRQPGDPAVLVADATRIRRELGWQPRFEELPSIVETAWGWERNMRDTGLC